MPQVTRILNHRKSGALPHGLPPAGSILGFHDSMVMGLHGSLVTTDFPFLTPFLSLSANPNVAIHS